MRGEEFISCQLDNPSPPFTLSPSPPPHRCCSRASPTHSGRVWGWRSSWSGPRPRSANRRPSARPQCSCSSARRLLRSYSACGTHTYTYTHTHTHTHTLSLSLSHSYNYIYIYIHTHTYSPSSSLLSHRHTPTSSRQMAGGAGAAACGARARGGGLGPAPGRPARPHHCVATRQGVLHLIGMNFSLPAGSLNVFHVL